MSEKLISLKKSTAMKIAFKKKRKNLYINLFQSKTKISILSNKHKRTECLISFTNFVTFKHLPESLRKIISHIVGIYILCKIPSFLIYFQSLTLTRFVSGRATKLLQTIASKMCLIMIYRSCYLHSMFVLIFFFYRWLILAVLNSLSI